MVEHKVGETFHYGDALLKVEKIGFLNFCVGCYFYDRECFGIDRERCVGFARKDGQDVVFIEQKTQK